MRFTLDDDEVQRIATAVTAQLHPFLEATMSAFDQALQRLEQQVQANTDAEQSATTLIQGLATEIAANAHDPQAVLDLTTKLKASADSLASAVTANTPAASPAAPATSSSNSSPVTT